MLNAVASEEKKCNIKEPTNVLMETNEQNKKDLGDKKWNGEQNRHLEHTEFNEGFSSENIPADYNPAPLKTELEINDRGESIAVDRARHDGASPNHETSPIEKLSEEGNQQIENPKSYQNKDRNYDLEDNRYPADHPENHRNRGNINLGE